MRRLRPASRPVTLVDVDRRADLDAVEELDHVGIRIRTQPCEAAVPIEPVSSVPWMPAPS